MLLASLVPVIAASRAGAAAPTLTVQPAEVLAGTAGARFTVTVAMPLCDAPPEDCAASRIEIDPPSWLSARDCAVVPVPGAEPGPSQVGCRVRASHRDVLVERPAMRAETVTLIVIADVGTPGADTAARWNVALSDVPAGSTSAGATTTIRVFEITAVTPADLTPTEYQLFSVDCSVRNAGSADPSVTLSLTSDGDLTVVSSPTPFVLGRGTSQTRPFSVRMTGDPAALTCTATATQITASGESDEVDAQLGLSVSSASITPHQVPPASTQWLSVTFATSSEVEATILGTGTRLDISGLGVTARMTSDVVVPPRDASAPITERQTSFVFDPSSIPAVADASFEATLTLAFRDENGLTGSLPVATDGLIVDGTNPGVTPALVLDPSLIAGRQPAARNGADFAASGPIVDPAGGGSPCTTCTIEVAFIRQYSSASESAAVGTDRDVSDDVSNDDGSVSGDITMPFHEAARFMRFFVQVRDLAGHPSPVTASGFFEVDNEVPEIDAAISGGDDKRRFDTIDVTISEPVTGATTARDWRVGGRAVLGVAATSPTTFRLQVDDDIFLLRQDAVTTVSYRPCPLVALQTTPACPAPLTDRVGNAVAGEPKGVGDGIRPFPPELALVDGEWDHGGKYYTNEPNPTFVIDFVTPGHTVTVIEDRDDDEVFDRTGPDRILGTSVVDCDVVVVEEHQVTLPGCPAELGSVGWSDSVTSSVTFTADREMSVLVIATDPNGNDSDTIANGTREELTAYDVVLDYTRPVITGAAPRSGNTEVLVCISEDLAFGRNDAADWFVTGGAPPGDNFHVASVAAPSANRRLLAVDDSRVTGETTFTSVTYGYDGLIEVPPGGQPAGVRNDERYRDIAGNAMVNQDGIPLGTCS